MMVSQQLDHVVNVYGFISTSISPITNKLYRMVNQKTLILSFKNDEITTTSSRCWHLWLFIKRYKTYRNQTSYEKKPPCTDLTLQLLIPIRSHDQCLWLHLYCSKPYNNQTWQNSRPAYTDLTLQVAMRSLQLSHVVNIIGIIFTSISSITIEMSKAVDQFLLILPFTNTLRSRDKCPCFIFLSISLITTNFTVTTTSLRWPHFTDGDYATTTRSRNSGL